MKKKINLTNIIDQCANLSKDFTKMFEETKDMKAGENAIKASNATVNAFKAQLMHKRITTFPTKIPFAE